MVQFLAHLALRINLGVVHLSDEFLYVLVFLSQDETVCYVRPALGIIIMLVLH